MSTGFVLHHPHLPHLHWSRPHHHDWEAVKVVGLWALALLAAVVVEIGGLVFLSLLP